MHFDRDLTDHVPEEWKQDIDQLIFKGSPVIQEVVFFHQQSKTLILTDLIENFEADKTKSWLFKMVYKLGAIASPDGQTPRGLRATFIGHKKVARECFQSILNWQPEKVNIAHGQWFEKDGVNQLKRAFRWLN